jgi:hypothetical protein
MAAVSAVARHLSLEMAKSHGHISVAKAISGHHGVSAASQKKWPGMAISLRKLARWLKM